MQGDGRRAPGMVGEEVTNNINIKSYIETQTATRHEICAICQSEKTCLYSFITHRIHVGASVEMFACAPAGFVCDECREALKEALKNDQ